MLNPLLNPRRLTDDIPCTHSRPGCLSCYYLLATVSDAAGNTVCADLQEPLLGSLGHMPRKGIAGSYTNSLVNSLKSHYTGSYSNGISLHPISSHFRHLRLNFLRLIYYFRESVCVGGEGQRERESQADSTLTGGNLVLGSIS